jgi:arabinose-5-phosphate isomerase
MDYWKDGQEAIDIESKGIALLSNTFKESLSTDFDSAIDLILRTKGRVIVSGIGKSGIIGRKFAATLSSTGTPAQFIHPSEASHGDLGAVTSADVVVMLSNSGESGELTAILEHTKRFDIPCIGITSQPDSTLGRKVSVVLKTPTAEEACPHGLAPTTSTAVLLVLCDAIAVSLLKARKFLPSDFRVNHPGGKLGAQIHTVQSLMHKAADLPLVQSDLTMRKALVVMSEKRFGILGVVDNQDKLVGVISDGDLRRHIANPGLLDEPVANIMTHRPRVIAHDELLSVAARNMELNQITALFVLDSDRKVAGLIRLADLLTSGML